MRATSSPTWGFRVSAAILAALNDARRQLERASGRDAPVENARNQAPGEIQLGRTSAAYATTPAGPSSIDRVFTVVEAHDTGVAAGKITADTVFEQPSVPQADYD